MPKSKPPRNKSRNRTPLSGHTHSGKQLLPPFAKMGDKIVFSSWANDRMPDMLWAVIIRGIGDQKFAISEYRRILKFIIDNEQKESYADITHSGIAKIFPELRTKLIACITANPITARALTILRLFEALPAKEDWLKHLPSDEADIDLLMASVGSTLWHQSQESTDCRWVRLMGQLLAGKLHVPREMAKNWLGYPDVGDQQAVRPSIRAAEVLEPLEPKDKTWPKAFWHEAWENTSCLVLQHDQPKSQPDNSTICSEISRTTQRVEEQWQKTHSTTDIDARHDAVFGMVLYSLRVLEEMVSSGIGPGILGRLGLRTILEVYLSLRYLLLKDDPHLWKKWRAYGAGQAKLNALRFDTDVDLPKFISIEWLEQIAGEDLWEEFLTIELGSWSGLDLRKMSDQSGTKNIYDAHYSWSSGYVHGTWGPIREACFATCGNPLHRLNRYPYRNNLQDTVSDAVSLTNLILDNLNIAYPSLDESLHI